MGIKINLVLRSLILVLISSLVVITFSALKLSGIALSQKSSPVTMQASIGFGDNVKPNSWIPVQVHLENSGQGLEGYLQVNFLDVEDKSVYRFPVELPSGAKKEFTIYVYAPNYAYEAEVSFYSSEQRLANQKLQISMRTPNDRLVGIAAQTPSYFNVLNLVDPPSGHSYTAVLDLSRLPDHSLALESLDVILVSDVDSGALTQAQVQALSAWVANGGRLVLFAGPGWQKVTAGLSGSGLLPLTPTGTQMVEDWSNLSSAASAQTTLAGQGIAATGALSQDAQVLIAAENDIPLVVQKVFGAGEVLFITVDPTLSPLNGWPGMENLYRYLLSRAISVPPWQYGINDWYSAANAAQTLPNLNLPPVLLVCGFLIVYMLILGPVNYLVVRKLKRRELGWFTTSALIILFSLLVLVSGGLSRSRQPILNRLSVMQIWPGAPLARVDGLIGIYSPFRGTYQLNFTGGTLAHNLPLGISASSRGNVISQNGSGGNISDLRVEVSSIQTVSLESFIPSPQFTGELTISIDNNGAALTGSLVNASDIQLENAVLLTSGGVVQLGTFKAGETREINQALNRSLSLQPSLTGAYPSKPVFSPTGPILPSPYYSGSPFALEDIIGTTDFYSSREVYRKYSLASAIVYNSNSMTSSGNEVYLSGWTNEPVLDANLNVKTDNQDTSLLLVRFDPTIKTSGNEIKIASEYFSWTPLDNQSANFSPYQMYFYGTEEFSFEYKPTLPLDFGAVSGLIFHLEGQGISGQTSEVEVYLWNVNKADWEKISGVNWGDNSIKNPGNYVQPDGTIQLQLRGAGQFINITRADFTMFVSPVNK